MPNSFELLPDSLLRDLADNCGRGHWRSEAPLAASTYFVQRSRVENWRVVSGMIRDRSDVLDDERTRKAVWASVCQAVDVHLGEPGYGGATDRALAALAIADREDAGTELAKFAIHRMQGGSRSWANWMGLGALGEVTDGR
jgi:hypothetical protein